MHVATSSRARYVDGVIGSRAARGSLTGVILIGSRAARGSLTGVLLITVIATGGCYYKFDLRAETAYREGRYLETAERLERYELEVATLGAGRQARYGLYRGLANLRIGDRVVARRWLAYTYDVEKRQPTLAPDQRALLDAGWTELQGPPNP